MRIYYNQNPSIKGTEREEGLWYDGKIVLVRTDNNYHIIEGIAVTYKRQTKDGRVVSDMVSIPDKDRPYLEARLRETEFKKPIHFK